MEQVKNELEELKNARKLNAYTDIKKRKHIIDNTSSGDVIKDALPKPMPVPEDIPSEVTEKVIEKSLVDAEKGSYKNIGKNKNDKTKKEKKGLISRVKEWLWTKN